MFPTARHQPPRLERLRLRYSWCRQKLEAAARRTGVCRPPHQNRAAWLRAGAGHGQVVDDAARLDRGGEAVEADAAGIADVERRRKQMVERDRPNVRWHLDLRVNHVSLVGSLLCVSPYGRWWGTDNM